MYNIVEIHSTSSSSNKTQQDNRLLVEGVLPYGLSVLGAGHKIGKSIFTTQLAVAVVMGTPFLGVFPTQKTDCLYISLDETRDDIYQRIPLELRDHIRGLYVTESWRPADLGGIELLGHWLRTNPNCKLVVIDVLARFYKGTNIIQQSYAKAYDSLSKLKDVADNNGSSLLLLHHTIKSKYRDWTANTYGSNALNGLCDGILSIDRDRTQDDAALKITGRSIADLNYMIYLNRTTLQWEFLCQEHQNKMSGERQEVLLLLGEAYGPLQLQDIAGRIRKSKQNTCNLLSKMVRIGLVAKPKYSLYQLTPLGEAAYRDILNLG